MGRLALFEPFRSGPFSLYFTGQVVSNTGTWMQNLALSLVVLDATGSASALSHVTIAQFTPILLLSVPAGRLADRVRPRTILLATSLLSAVIVTGLAFAVSGDAPAIWAIYALVAALGSVHAFERVAAQTIIFELVGPGVLSRAVAISTITLAAARSIGPGLAGLAFQSLGPTVCMLLNAASFIGVFGSILLIRPRRLFARPPRAASSRRRLREITGNRPLFTLLIVNVVIALFSLNLMIVITSTVVLTFTGDATAVGAAHGLNAAGAIAGGLLAAAVPRTSVRALAPASAALAIALLCTAAAPTLMWFLVAGPLLGLGVGYYQGVLNASAQSSVAPQDIGRTMSLVTLGNYGMVPFGALLIGGVIDSSSGRVALLIGSIAALASALFVWIRLGRSAQRAGE